MGMNGKTRPVEVDVCGCAVAIQEATNRLAQATIQLYQATEKRIAAEMRLEQTLFHCDLGYRDSMEWQAAARQSYPELFEAVEEAKEGERLARTTVTLAQINRDNVTIYLRLAGLSYATS